jgi:nucleoside phosphorylase
MFHGWRAKLADNRALARHACALPSSANFRYDSCPMSAHRKTDVLVLAAHAPELVGLRDALGAGLRGTIGSLEVECATVGVGLPASASGTTRALQAIQPRAVVLLGSCGLYPRRIEFRALTPVVATGVRLVDAHVLNDHAAFPAPMQLLNAPDRSLSEGLAQTDPSSLRGEVATTLAITTDDALAQTIGSKSGCAAENLEAYAVALACAAHDLPYACVLVATNAVGSQGRQQWQNYQRSAAEKAAELLIAWLERGAKGLPGGA